MSSVTPKPSLKELGGRTRLIYVEGRAFQKKEVAVRSGSRSYEAEGEMNERARNGTVTLAKEPTSTFQRTRLPAQRVRQVPLWGGERCPLRVSSRACGPPGRTPSIIHQAPIPADSLRGARTCEDIVGLIPQPERHFA